MRSNSSGIVQLGELDIIYIGEENITIFAHFDGSENISSANATLDISVRIENISKRDSKVKKFLDDLN